jgi:hypothetical protein
MKGRRVEVRTTWPNQGAGLRVQTDLGEHRRVTKWAEELAGQHRSKVNSALQAIGEPQTQGVHADVVNGDNSMNRVVHVGDLAVEVREVMPPSRLCEHPDHDAVEAG